MVVSVSGVGSSPPPKQPGKISRIEIRREEINSFFMGWGVKDGPENSFILWWKGVGGKKVLGKGLIFTNP